VPIKAKVLAKILALAAAASLALAAPAFAETLSSSPTSESAPAVQAENQPQRLRLCDKENPAIDYRACVNASTRDLSKKIRQA
jgi:hypothetical protein